MLSRFRRPPAARRGFTLVELLVAAALSVVIMYILAAAFKTGTDTLSSLKSLGTLSDQLRTAETVLTSDLAAPHLEDETGAVIPVSVATKPGYKSLTSSSTAALPWDTSDPLHVRRGFLRAVQEARATTNEEAAGTDPDNAKSFRITNDWIAFTVRLSGASSAEAFAADTNAGGSWLTNISGLQDLSLKSLGASTSTGTTFYGRWAEVTYFLVSNGTTTTADTGTPLALHTLYRRAKVLSPVKQGITGSLSGTPPADTLGVQDVSIGPNASPTFVNSPETVTDPANRFATGTAVPAALTGTHRGSDIVLSNVISMEVNTLTDTNVEPVPPTVTTVFDTHDTTLGGSATGTRPRLRAVQIKLRVYDTKNLITRQVTIVQEL